MTAWAAAVEAAGKLVDSYISSRSGNSPGAQGSKNRQFALDDRGWQRNRFVDDRAWSRNRFIEDRLTDFGRQDSTFQRAVKDARLAGLHPLFALGTAGAGGGGGHMFGSVADRSTADVAPSGGSLGSAGLGAAGEAINRAFGPEGKRHQARLESEIKVNDALANLYNSQAAKAVQEANSGPRMNEDGSIVYPIGTKPGVALQQGLTHIKARPTVANPNVSSPLRQTLIADDGYRYRTLTDEAGDDLKQLDLAYQGIARMTRKARLALPRELKLWYGRQKIIRGQRKRQPKNRRNF